MQLEKNSYSYKKIFFVVSAILLTAIVLAIIQDLLFANFNQSAFYLSESFIFTSFWWLFAPILFIQHRLMIQVKRQLILLPLVLVATALHLFAYPLFVWLLSKICFDYTFRYTQTLQYSLSNHLYFLLFFYSIPLGIHSYFRQKKSNAVPLQILKTSFIVSEGSRKTSVLANEILYFSANSPYINIHLKDRTYLYQDTLKAIEKQVDSSSFIRIHKSTIVNINEVKMYKSRLNGDYDLMLFDGIELRISRNYVPQFKTAFEQSHRVDTK